MKTKIDVILILIVVIAALHLREAEAEDTAQVVDSIQDGDNATRASLGADFDRMKETSIDSCEYFREVLQQLQQSEPDESIPDKVFDRLNRGCEEAQALAASIDDGDTAAAKKHYRKSIKNLAKVSRWLLENGEEKSIPKAEKKSEVRLQKVFERMVRRAAKLRERAEAAGLEVDLTEAYELSQQIAASFQDGDLETVYELNRQLKQAVLAIEESIEQQEESEAL